MSNQEEPHGSRALERTGAALAFVGRHWRPILRGGGLLLVLVFVLQNVEPTRVDFLFWSLPGVPKLVLILISMALGAILSELVRRYLSSSG